LWNELGGDAQQIRMLCYYLTAAGRLGRVKSGTSYTLFAA
jgi:hypothetical protein